LGDPSQLAINEIVAIPLSPIRQHADIPKLGLAHAVIDVSGKLIFGFALRFFLPQIPLNFNDCRSGFNVDPTPIPERRFEDDVREIAVLKLKRRRENKLANVRLYLGLGSPSVANHKSLKYFGQ
jgi:hypothetical protein